MEHGSTVTFLPHRLNRQPVVFLGLTADEMWGCVALSGGLGAVLGIVLAIAIGSVAIAPAVAAAAIFAGLFVGGRMLRRYKRGRPDAWVYRHLQWRFAKRFPTLAPKTGTHPFILRSGWWSTRRQDRSAAKPKQRGVMQ
jgi:conjugative transfer region protein (TIGR03750 family)